jgi:hypothetical protein
MGPAAAAAAAAAGWGVGRNYRVVSNSHSINTNTVVNSLFSSTVLLYINILYPTQYYIYYIY